MSLSKGIRCTRPKTTESCLSCPYKMCIYDILDMEEDQRKVSYILAVHDDFVAETFANTTEGAKWLLSMDIVEQRNVNTLSSRIRKWISRYQRIHDIAWYRLENATSDFYRYVIKHSIIFIKFDSKKNVWRIVKKAIHGDRIQPFSASVYATKEIAQVVLDTYADDHGLRLFDKMAM